MSAPVIAKDCAVYYGGYDVTRAHRTLGFECAWEELDDTRFPDQAKASYPGVQMPKASGEGFFRAGSGEIDAINGLRMSAPGTPWPWTVCPVGDSDLGLAYTMQAAHMSYNIGASHGQSLPFKLGMSPARVTEDARLVRGQILLPKATRTDTTNGSAIQLGALSASQRIIAVLHVFAETGGGTWTLTIESDDNSDFSSATTRITFTGATGVTRECKQLDGAVTDDYWRAVLTKSGGTNCVAFAMAGILPI
jgi:hypothetical protein